MRRLKSYVLLAMLVIGMLVIPAKVEAATIAASGTATDGIEWKLYDDGLLVLSGDCAMENHKAAGRDAWGSWVCYQIEHKAEIKYVEKNISRVVVSAGITQIGDAAFAYCENNSKAEIGSTVKRIGHWAFYDNKRLKEVVIPASVRDIGMLAFENCSSLTDVYYGGTKNQWNKISVDKQNDYLLNARIHCTDGEYVKVDPIDEESKKPQNVKGALSGGYNDVKISWKKVSGAKGYNVYCKKSTDDTYTERMKQTTKTTCTFSNLEDGTEFTFKVIPYFTKEKKESKQYTEVSVTTLERMETPLVEEYNSSKVKISWDSINNVDGYQVSKSTKKSGTNSIGSTTSLSKTSEVSKNKTYYYKVRAYKKVNGKKIYTPWSEPVSYKLRYVYSVSNLKATLIAENAVKVSWKKATGANAYDVSAMIGDEMETGYMILNNDCEFEFHNLKKGTEYTFVVTPLYVEENNVIKEGKSKSASVTTLKQIEIPTLSTSGDRVKVSWFNIGGETGYQISKSKTPYDINIVSTYKTSKGTYKLLKATSEETYYYQVRAYKEVGSKKIYGEWSEPVSYTLSPIIQKGTYEKDYGSTKYILKVKEVTGNEVKFQLLFAGRYASGKSNVITKDAENGVIEFTFKDYNAKGKVIGKGKGTLVLKNGTIVLNTVATSGNTQLSTSGVDEVLMLNPNAK